MYDINRAAVIGAGTMGLGIAGQLANAGVEVLLLDIPAAGDNRNAITERALQRLLDENQPGLLHTDKVIFHTNSVTGLVESMVGVVPGGGGVKEMLYRWYERTGDINKAAWSAFMNIGYGKTARSPLEAEPLAMFRNDIDSYIMNRDRLLDTAMSAVDKLSAGYEVVRRLPLAMPGRDVWAEMTEWLRRTHEKGHLTPHNVTTGSQIAMIVTGGDIDAGTELAENDLFALERKAFVTLGRSDQTRARIEFMLEHGSPLRN